MPLLLREFEGYDLENASKYTTASLPVPAQLSEGEVPTSPLGYSDILVTIEAIHCAPFGTRNYTRYTEDACRKSLQSWTNPYKIPTIMYHNDYDGVVNGRIQEAVMGISEKTGGPVLILKASAPGYRTEADIRNEILKTVSIGVSATDVRCSICGKHLEDGDFCEHTKGYTYDGETCYWDVHAFEAKELSYVIVPSDKFAQVISLEGPGPQSGDGHPADNRLNLRGRESENLDNSPNTLHITEAADSENISEPANLNTEEGENLMAEQLKLEEAVSQIEALTVENQALKGDKKSFQESVTQLNNDKIELQNAIDSLKSDLENARAELSQEKSMREAAEKQVADLNVEVKNSLVTVLGTMREQAGKPKIEKLEERSIDSLRDAIADLKLETQASSVAAAQGSVENPAIQTAESAVDKKTAPEPEDTRQTVVENFDL